MIKGLYCIKDEKAETYGFPFQADNDAMAERALDHNCQIEGSLMESFPLDFRLYKVADFDTETGVVTPLDTLQFVAQGKPSQLNEDTP